MVVRYRGLRAQPHSPSPDRFTGRSRTVLIAMWKNFHSQITKFHCGINNISIATRNGFSGCNCFIGKLVSQHDLYSR